MPKNSASATVTTKCPACGSSTIIPNVEVSGDSILAELPCQSSIRPCRPILGWKTALRPTSAANADTLASEPRIPPSHWTSTSSLPKDGNWLSDSWQPYIVTIYHGSCCSRRLPC